MTALEKSTRAERLRAYREAARGAPTIGVDDCGPWVAHWVERECGVKIPFPRYATREEGYRIVAAGGGLPALMSDLLAAVPLWEAAGEPAMGDVCAVGLSDRELAGICCGNNLVLIRDDRRGTHILHSNYIVKAWALP